MESVLLSIRPVWCEKIANGKKTIEVRKTRPKLETPFQCYIFCTKDKRDSDRLWILDKQNRAKYFGVTAVCFTCEETPEHCSDGNGKVIGEFVCDRIDAIDVIDDGIMTYIRVNQKADMFIAQETCLGINGLQHYLDDRSGYGWHISDLKIYDKPKELGEFRRCGVNYHFNPAVTKPPQSWCYVEELQ